MITATINESKPNSFPFLAKTDLDQIVLISEMDSNCTCRCTIVYSKVGIGDSWLKKMDDIKKEYEILPIGFSVTIQNA